MKHVDLKKINDIFGAILSILTKSEVIVFMIILLILFVVVAKREGFWINEFEVPTSFEEDGISGKVVARLIADEINGIEADAYYKLNEIYKQEMIEDEKALSGSVKLAVVEFQIEDLLRYLGIDKRKTINGELLKSGNTLRLNVRIPEEGMATFEATYDIESNPVSRYQALEILIASAGEFLVEKTNPMILAYYYYSQLTDEGIERSIEISTDVIGSNHRDAKFAHYLIADRMWCQYADTRESLEQLDKALALDPNFAEAWFLMANITLYPYCVEILGQPNQTLEFIFGDLDETDRLEMAIEFYESGLKADPNDFFALIDLAHIYAFKKENPTRKDLETAVMYFERAKEHYQEYFEMEPSKNASYGKERLELFEEGITKVQKTNVK